MTGCWALISIFCFHIVRGAKSCVIHRHPASQTAKHLHRAGVFSGGRFLPGLHPVQKIEAKKTPLGERGIRVIVVVAN